MSAVAQSLSITPAFSRQQRMSTQTPAWVATAAGAGFSLREIDLGPLRDDQVEVAVEHCGLCRSDLAMWRNEWGRSHYPFVGGHEVIGRVVQLGSGARGVCPGQRVGIGWISHSCLACEPCRGGALHQCETLGRLLIDGVGGFAARDGTDVLAAVRKPRRDQTADRAESVDADLHRRQPFFESSGRAPGRWRAGNQ